MPHQRLISRRKLLKSAAMATFVSAMPSSSAMALSEDTQKVNFRMSPEIGVCTSVDNAALLAQAGASYIEANVGRLLMPDKPYSEFIKKLGPARSSPIPVRAANCFLPGSLKSVGPKADHSAVLAFAETAFVRARQVGIKTIVFGSSGSRSIPDGFARDEAELQFVALLAKMAPLAKANEVTVVVEPLNKKEVNFINSLYEGARLVEPVQHPNIRLLADFYHMMREDEPPDHITHTGHLLHHIHIAERAKRTAPGVAGDDFRPYLRALNDTGYAGLISMECRWDDMPHQLPQAVKALQEQISDF